MNERLRGRLGNTFTAILSWVCSPHRAQISGKSIGVMLKISSPFDSVSAKRMFESVLGGDGGGFILSHVLKGPANAKLWHPRLARLINRKSYHTKNMRNRGLAGAPCSK